MKSPIRLLLSILIATFFALVIAARFLLLPDSRSGDLRREVATQGRLSFLIVGDIGTGDEHQLAVAHAMEDECQKLRGITAIIFLGDNFYMNGVDSTTDPQWIEKIERPYSSQCLESAPIIPILGNHDYRGNTDAQVAYSSINPRWWLPHRFHRVDFGSTIRIIGFDSIAPDLCFLPDFCASDFLRKELLSSKQRWTVVLGHSPLLSSSEDNYSYNGHTPLGLLMRHYLCNKADAWFSGHAHHLEHLEMEGCRSSLFVSGGGGGNLQDLGTLLKESRFAAKEHGFLRLLVDDMQFSAAFIDIHGQVLYEHTK